MRRVVDPSILRAPSPVLEKYLGASPRNFAVLTDYASMESFKGDGEVNLPRALEVLRHFPRQVIVLKSTSANMRLRPRAKGIQGRLIDEQQTAGFEQWCREVFVNRQSDPWVTWDLRMKSQRANMHFAVLERGMEKVGKGMEMTFRSYPLDALRALRRRDPIPVQHHDRIIKDIMAVTAACFRNMRGEGVEIPMTKDAFYSFPFRYSLCSYLLMLKWFADGGHQGAATSKLRNDFTDMTYAAYATFFAGLLTEDRKMHEVYLAAVWTLENVFL